MAGAGELRGAEPTFDLGHFLLHDDRNLLASLLAGYHSAPDLKAIRRSAVLLALRQLCRWLGPPRNLPLTASTTTRRAHRITQLIASVGAAR